MKKTREQLYNDVIEAYRIAKRHKSAKIYVLKFDLKFEENINNIVDELYNRNYKVLPSTCFIIEDPKKREVFAADFRDRIVQHLYYMYTYELFERLFIYDSYSCRNKKGTLFGIRRLERHIKSESNNWKEPCYCLQLDIKGYFMSINKKLLIDIIISNLDRKRYDIYKDGKTFDEILDFDLLYYLTREIVNIDPTDSCIFKSNKCKWDGLPDSKSLFKVDSQHGLPIGNLTSQLFSNIYMNVFDQFVKKELKFKHYGRYVDDSYIVCRDKDRLRECIPIISKFLKDKLDLSLQFGKTKIVNAKNGVNFCGAFVKPYRTYVSNKSLKRMNKKLSMHNPSNTENYEVMVQSYLGMLSHYKSFKIRYNVIAKANKLLCKVYEV